MDYKLHYDKLINNRRDNPITEGYMEKHHILPRSLGGSDNNDNLINLTAKEHFIAHLLLTKTYKKKSVEYYKMIKAFWCMRYYKGDHQNRYVSSNEYSWLREEFSKAQSKLQEGEKNSQYGTFWIYSDELRSSKKIPKSEEIPKGWSKGRVLDFDSRNCKIRSKEEKKLLDFEVKENRREGQRLKHLEWYKIYDKLGFRGFCDSVGYDKSQSTLKSQFRYYIGGFPFNKKGIKWRKPYIPSINLLNRISEKLSRDGAIFHLKSYTSNKTCLTFTCKCGNNVSSKRWMNLQRSEYIARCKECYNSGIV